MQLSEVGEALRVALIGRLDTAGAGQLEAGFGAAVVAKGRPTVIDLAEVPFLASLGVRMFISTARSLAFKGARMAVFNASPEVMDVIETTQLYEIVPVATSEVEALDLVLA